MGQRGRGNATVVGLSVDSSVAVNLHLEVSGQGVNDRDTNTVQPTRHLVTAATELPTGVQNGQNHLHCWLFFHRMLVHWNSATVVDNSDPTIGEQRHRNRRGVTGHCLVHRVVDDFVDEVVQAPLTGGADVHARAFADGIKALENGDRTCVVGHRVLPFLTRRLGVSEGMAGLHGVALQGSSGVGGIPTHSTSAGPILSTPTCEKTDENA